jgi:predicted RNA-binding protein YlqC (UPF0109 family)
MTTTLNGATGTERKIRDMVLSIVRLLVDYPEDVEVAQLSNLEGSVFCIRVHPQDVGKLVGNGGQIERALRCVVLASGRKLGHRLTIDIAQESRGLR